MLSRRLAGSNFYGPKGADPSFQSQLILTHRAHLRSPRVLLDFIMGLKKARAGPKLENRIPEGTPAPGARLDERETPCVVAKDDCGGINTQSPVSQPTPSEP